MASRKKSEPAVRSEVPVETLGSRRLHSAMVPGGKKFRKDFMKSCFDPKKIRPSSSKDVKEKSRTSSAKDSNKTTPSTKERTRTLSAKETTRKIAKSQHCESFLIEVKEKPKALSSEDTSSIMLDDGKGTRDTWTSVTDGLSVPFFSQVKCPSSIEQVILAFKAEATRRLQPALLESVKLKSQASPSVKQFLEVYDRPTAIDKFTGKFIPLRQIYEQEITKRKYRGSTLSSMNKAMSTIARQTEARAEVILTRRDPYDNMLTEKDGFWYCDLPGLIDDTAQTMSAVPLPPSKKKVLPETRRIEDKESIKGKKLPIYLMAKGDVRAPSLEWIGRDMVYCTPSQRQCPNTEGVIITDRERSRRTMERVDCSYTPGHFFLTENQYSSQDNRHSTSRGKSDYYEKTQTNKLLKFQGWQPLTKSALLEHTTVSEVPVVKKKTYRHNIRNRQHQLWRPLEAAPTSSFFSKTQQGPNKDYMDCARHYNTVGYSDASNNFYSKYSNMYNIFFGFPSDV